MDQEMQKITVEVSVAALEAAKKFVGGGVTDAVREGVECLARKQAQSDFAKLKGSIPESSLTIEEMRSWETPRAWEKDYL